MKKSYFILPENGHQAAKAWRRMREGRAPGPNVRAAARDSVRYQSGKTRGEATGRSE